MRSNINNKNNNYNKKVRNRVEKLLLSWKIKKMVISYNNKCFLCTN